MLKSCITICTNFCCIFRFQLFFSNTEILKLSRIEYILPILIIFTEIFRLRINIWNFKLFRRNVIGWLQSRESHSFELKNLVIYHNHYRCLKLYAVSWFNSIQCICFNMKKNYFYTLCICCCFFQIPYSTNPVYVVPDRLLDISRSGRVERTRPMLYDYTVSLLTYALQFLQ